MDLSKTQFLIEKFHTSTRITAYRRKRQTMLFDHNDKPLRLMDWEQWRDFKAQFPREIEADGLTYRTVWTLVPITGR